MLNLKKKKMMPYSMKFAKKTKVEIKFQKMKGTYFFGKHPLVEKSPTVTVCVHILFNVLNIINNYFLIFLYLNITTYIIVNILKDLVTFFDCTLHMYKIE